MDEYGNKDIILVAIIMIGLLIFAGMLMYGGYLDKKLETEQPRYFIEFKGNTYELKEVE